MVAQPITARAVSDQLFWPILLIERCYLTEAVGCPPAASGGLPGAGRCLCNDSVRAQKSPHPVGARTRPTLPKAMFCNRGEHGLDIARQHMVATVHQGPGPGRAEQAETGTG